MSWRRWWPFGQDDRLTVPTEADREIAKRYFLALTTPAGRDLYHDLMTKFYDVPCEGERDEGARRVCLHLTNMARAGMAAFRGEVSTAQEMNLVEKAGADFSGDPVRQLITGGREPNADA